MNARERMLAAIEFRRPDRIPLFYYPSPAGLYVHGEKLRRLLTEVAPDNIAPLPEAIPDPRYFDAAGNYHEISRDAWGVEWEYLIYGIQGHPKSHPLSNWEEAKSYRFPDHAVVRPDRRQRDEYLIFGGIGSLFERVASLQRFDTVMMDFFTRDPALLAFVDRLVEYYLQINRRYLDAGTDVFCFGDDFGTQSNAIFPPETFAEIFVPRYRKLFEPLQRAGKKILFHSCGKIDVLLPLLLELHVDILWPQLSLYGRDENFLDRCAENQTALLLHPDRQYLIPRGTPTEIRSWVGDMAARYRNGGGIFYIEMENDAPWENVRTLIETIAELR